MFDLGVQELIVIFVVALLVFGPKKLPEIGRTLGRSLAEIKRSLETVKHQMDAEFHDVKELKELKDLKDLANPLSSDGKPFVAPPPETVSSPYVEAAKDQPESPPAAAAGEQGHEKLGQGQKAAENKAEGQGRA